VRGYPMEPAAAYLGLGIARFRSEVRAQLLPQPVRHGKRLVWDRVALDRYLDKKVDGADPTAQPLSDDPIMRSIHAAQPAALRGCDPR
jgi:hypothetical protein